jgi:hypothetical protein
MAIQEIIKIVVVLVSLIISCSCTNDHKVATIEQEPVSNCLDAIHIVTSDSILFYWANIAADSNMLAEHEGNSRIVISKSGRLYTSYNKGQIKNLDNYFNTTLVYYKTLSAQEMTLLTDALLKWEVHKLPAVVHSPDVISSHPIRKYMYVDSTNLKTCIMFEMQNDLTTKIENFIKELL